MILLLSRELSILVFFSIELNGVFSIELNGVFSIELSGVFSIFSYWLFDLFILSSKIKIYMINKCKKNKLNK